LFEKITELPAAVAVGSRLIPAGPLNIRNKPDIFSQIVDFLHPLDDEKKSVWINCFAKSVGRLIPDEPTAQFKAVGWRKIKEMQAEGIEIGGHSVTHASMANLTNDQMLLEVGECKRKLDLELGVMERDFCYPSGQPSDYTPKVKEIVRDQGFRSSVVAFYDKREIDDAFELRRYSIGDDYFQFLKAVNGVEALSTRIVGSHNRFSQVY